MRYCHNCHKVTTGEPLFCQFCGSTYDAKLCPARHMNPRWATVCSQCGSRDLSTPAPKIPLIVRPLLLLFGLSPGFLLLAGLIVYVGFYVHRLFTDPAGLLPLMVLGLGLGLLLLLWMSLPKIVRSGFTRHGRRDRHNSSHKD